MDAALRVELELLSMRPTLPRCWRADCGLLGLEADTASRAEEALRWLLSCAGPALCWPARCCCAFSLSASSLAVLRGFSLCPDAVRRCPAAIEGRPRPRRAADPDAPPLLFFSAADALRVVPPRSPPPSPPAAAGRWPRGCAASPSPSSAAARTRSNQSSAQPALRRAAPCTDSRPAPVCVVHSCPCPVWLRLSSASSSSSSSSSSLAMRKSRNLGQSNSHAASKYAPTPSAPLSALTTPPTHTSDCISQRPSEGRRERQVRGSEHYSARSSKGERSCSASDEERVDVR